MNWLTDYVKPKLSSLVNRKEPPSDLWTKCGCGERTLYVSDLKENLNVCSYCDFHMGMDVNSSCLLYTSPSPRDPKISRMPSSA